MFPLPMRPSVVMLATAFRAPFDIPLPVRFRRPRRYAVSDAPAAVGPGQWGQGSGARAVGPGQWVCVARGCRAGTPHSRPGRGRPAG
ncbi:hypothetical protein FAIPA1_10504 [Frankia sp. AiPs1]